MRKYYFTKPSEDEYKKGGQLFSMDINTKGAKKFIITTYEEAYKIIEERENLYEDHTYNDKIKLHIDVDYNQYFSNQLERDWTADVVIDELIMRVNKKLLEIYNISDSRIIVLISETLTKLSLHIIYVDVIFISIYDMKYFLMNVSNFIDMNIYKHGCFRMLGSSQEDNI